MLAHDELIQVKEMEIASLHAQLAVARTSKDGYVDSIVSIETGQHNGLHEPSATTTSRHLGTSTVQPSRKGKAPPVDLFTGESIDVL